jgi:tRNA threonylcarbamoyladenosine biosynthesis protein TsaB
MKILAIDTAAGACSVALWTDAEVIERLEVRERGHAESLMPMLAGVMHAAGCAFAHLDLLAVTVGPGGFTGLRVGLAAARGLALACALPCLGVSTLEAVAEAIEWSPMADRQALVAIDNKQGGVYAQMFGAGRALGPAASKTFEALADEFRGERIAVAGDAATHVTAVLNAAGARAEAVAVPGYPTASRVAAIAARRWLTGERPTGPPVPVYLRAPATGPQ